LTISLKLKNLLVVKCDQEFPSNADLKFLYWFGCVVAGSCCAASLLGSPGPLCLLHPFFTLDNRTMQNSSRIAKASLALPIELHLTQWMYLQEQQAAPYAKTNASSWC
jgi:hypothetical protein